MSDTSTMYLVGDEDCGVGLRCRLCDDGGRLLAYYPGISGNPYDVPTVSSLESLMFAAQMHGNKHAEHSG